MISKVGRLIKGIGKSAYKSFSALFGREPIQDQLDKFVQELFRIRKLPPNDISTWEILKNGDSCKASAYLTLKQNMLRYLSTNPVRDMPRFNMILNTIDHELGTILDQPIHKCVYF